MWPNHRRRFSTIKRPLLPISAKACERYLVAPGMVRESLLYRLRHHYRGEFSPYQLGTRMNQWAGPLADKRGAEFSLAVSDALRPLGWKTEVEVKLTKIMRHKLDRDYGDLDVLEWRKSDGRVLIIECKENERLRLESRVLREERKALKSYTVLRKPKARTFAFVHRWRHRWPAELPCHACQ